MTAAKIDRVTFAGGEWGVQLVGRSDMAKYQIAVEKMENYIVMKGGGATRAPGTRMVLELKDQTQKGKLIPFRRSSSDYYALVFNGGAARFVRQGGFLQNPDTTPYEMVSPYVEADLAGLRPAQGGNTIYMASGAKKPQKITRIDILNWTCADYAPNSGPVATQNVDTAITVQASAVTGAVNLTGVGNPFNTDMIGGVIRLDDRDLSLTPEWVTTETAIALNAQRRWNGNVYAAQVAAADAGPNPPVHASGDVSAGNGKQTWRFLHPGYGVVRILSVTNGNTATGTVLTQLPATVVSGGSYRWSPPAWTAGLGYPDLVAYNYPRLDWYRGNIFWFTGNDDAENFDLANADDGDAISGRIIAPDGSLVEAKWALPSSGVLLLGTSDIEWVLRGPDAFAALTPKTIKPFPLGSDGSAPQIANAVDGGVMFLGRTQKRLHYGKVQLLSDPPLVSQELSVSAEHIFAPGMVGGCWQRDPFRVFWMWFLDGTLASLTFMPEQQVAAFCRHPRLNFFVEDMVCIPSVSSGVDEVYLIVRRTINGVTKRYVEQMAEYFTPQDIKAPTAAGAWFLDCALRITSVTGVTAITQLAHLEGQEIGVFADGAMQKRKTVAGGAITLDRKSFDILCGIPVRGYIRDLPRNFNTQEGSTTGEAKTIHEALVQVLYSGGGRLRKYDAEEDNPELWEPLIETGAQNYAGLGLPPLFSGKKKLTLDGTLDVEAQLEWECDDAMPNTVLALSPKLDVSES